MLRQWLEIQSSNGTQTNNPFCLLNTHTQMRTLTPTDTQCPYLQRSHVLRKSYNSVWVVKPRLSKQRSLGFSLNRLWGKRLSVRVRGDTHAHTLLCFLEHFYFISSKHIIGLSYFHQYFIAILIMLLLLPSWSWSRRLLKSLPGWWWHQQCLPTNWLNS